MPRPKGYSPNKAKESAEISGNNTESVEVTVEQSVEEVATPTPKPVENKEEVSVNTDAIKQLLEEVEKLKGQIAQVQSISHGTEQKIEKKFGEIGQGKNIPLADKLKTPVTFVMMGRGYVLSCYNMEGSEVRAPYGMPIMFKWRNSDVRKTADGEMGIHYSSYSAWSQKEVDFIKNSPYYGHLIFDTITGLSKVNPSLVAGIEQATTFVSNMTHEQLFGLAQTYKLDVNMGVNKLKTSIIAIKVQEIIDQDKAVYENVVAKLELQPSE
jgi:hypothetical protein